MEYIIDDSVSDADILKAKQAFEESNVDDHNKTKFAYAYTLIKSKHGDDIKKGIGMLEELYYGGDQSNRRDCMYYLAVGHTRLHDYNIASECIEHFLKYEPNNRQALQLREYIKKKVTKEGLIGMAIAGGSVLALGGLIGMMLSKK